MNIIEWIVIIVALIIFSRELSDLILMILNMIEGKAAAAHSGTDEEILKKRGLLDDEENKM